MLHWLELEEQVGWMWHRLVGDRASYPDHPDAAVTLAATRQMLAVFFHAVGGEPGVEIGAASAEESGHRLSFRQRLGMDAERLVPATLTESTLRLPERLALFPESHLNRGLYLWLAAFLAAARPVPVETDPLRRDLRRLRGARLAQERALARFPGLRDRFALLSAATLQVRPERPLSKTEQGVEAVVVALLGGPAPQAGLGLAYWQAVTVPEAGAFDRLLEDFASGRAHRPFLPVPLWGEALVEGTSTRPSDADGDIDSSPGDEPPDERKRKAKRKGFDQADRDDPLILNRFEKILALAEMINVNRAADDDEEENARKAADEMDEIAVSSHSKKAATRLRLDLDLPPQANIGGRLQGEYTYPEWDYRRRDLLPNHCRVVVETAEEEGEDWRPDEDTRRLIQRVRRQFEALRPRQVLFRQQQDGDDLDLEAVVRSRCDLAASGRLTDRVYQTTRHVARDLSVAVLVDVSLSSDAWIDNRRVLDVEKEALSVLLSGLAACGDEHCVYTFTSRKRDWVRLQALKEFDEPFNDRVLRRIAALRPGYYTRIGAAVRHAAAELEKRPHRHRLILLLTDGKPNDIDHYEGRFGIEDTRHAVLEARRKGLTVFGVTIDRKAQDYFPTLFGRGSYAIVSELARLSRALPRIYQSVAS